MKHRPLFTICSVITFMACLLIYLFGGYFIPSLKSSQAEQRFEDGETVSLVGQVYQKIEKEEYFIYYLSDVLIQSAATIQTSYSYVAEEKILIYDKTKQNPSLGEKIKVWGSIHVFEESRNPGNFDRKMYYREQGIHTFVRATVCKMTPDKNTAINISSLRWRLKNQLYRLRNVLEQSANAVMGEVFGSGLNAIVLGDKANMDEEMKTLFQKGGIVHILSISGLHLSFLGVGVYEALRRWTGSFKAGAFLSGIFLLLYVTTVGLGISIIRAVVMFLFRVGADLTGRAYDSVTALSVAAVIVLIWHPLAVINSGFYLSFGAVAAVVFLVPLFREMGTIGELLGSSIGIYLFTMPVLLRTYFCVTPYSILLNLIVIPMMSSLLVMGIAGMIAFLIFWPLGELLLTLCKLELQFFELICERSLKLPGAMIVLGKPTLIQIVVYYLCLFLCMWLWHRIKKQKLIFTDRNIKRGICILSVVGLLSITIHYHPAGMTQFSLIDVGQGDGIFLRGPTGKTYLIDCGSSTVEQVGKYRVVPYLNAEGIGTIDYAFVTHGDLDHLSGIQEILEDTKLSLNIKTLIVPVEKVWDDTLKELVSLAEKHGTKVIPISSNQYIYEESIFENDLKISCLFPDYSYNGDAGNEASLVLELEIGKVHFLLTGDLEGDGEQRVEELLESNQKSYDFLKVAHHGSKNSTGDSFLKEVAPNYALISAGTGNFYGHPHKDTLQRLNEQKIPYYCTKYNGCITVKIHRKGEYQITGWL